MFSDNTNSMISGSSSGGSHFKHFPGTCNCEAKQQSDITKWDGYWGQLHK